MFNKVFEYEDYWGDKYRETIKPSACTKEFFDTQDVKLNLLHKRDMSIARSNCGVGNLRISVNNEGVDFEFEAPNCDLGDRALELVRATDRSRYCSRLHSADGVAMNSFVHAEGLMVSRYLSPQ